MNDQQNELYQIHGDISRSIIIPSIHAIASKLAERDPDAKTCLLDLLKWTSLLLSRHNKEIEDCLYATTRYGTGREGRGFKTGRTTIERLARRLSELWVEWQQETRPQAEIETELIEIACYIVQITEQTATEYDTTLTDLYNTLLEQS